MALDLDLDLKILVAVSHFAVLIYFLVTSILTILAADQLLSLGKT